MAFPKLCPTGFPISNNIEYLSKKSELYFKQILFVSKNTQSTIVIGHIEEQEHFFITHVFIKNGTILHVHKKSKLWIDDVGIFKNGNDYSTVSVLKFLF